MIMYICAQPAEFYFAWQVEVMINNFLAMNINPQQIDIVCTLKKGPIPEEWKKLQATYPVRFSFYPDTRIRKTYISSVRPNALKQHFAKYPELSSEVIFYHDCDIIFTRPPSEWIPHYMLIDNKCYGSDTNGYIGSDYIESKGHDLLYKMCSIVGIPPSVVRKNKANCIGAQYLLKGIDRHFWQEVEISSESLYNEIKPLKEAADRKERDKFMRANRNTKLKYGPHIYNPLQIWCADMWAVLWELWKRGMETEVHPAFIFSWAGWKAADYDTFNIVHNAGVKADNKDLFYKNKYKTTLPYWENLELKHDSVSRKYFEWVRLTGLRTCLK